MLHLSWEKTKLPQLADWRAFLVSIDLLVVMIKGILIFNNNGKPRLSKFYQSVKGEAEQQSVIRRVFQQVNQRPDSCCNYLSGSIPEWGESTKIIYRQYATLFVVFAGKKDDSF
jgi:AP-3 complex subunit sigma